jgi:hypothetical protein
MKRSFYYRSLKKIIRQVKGGRARDFSVARERVHAPTPEYAPSPRAPPAWPPRTRSPLPLLCGSLKDPVREGELTADTSRTKEKMLGKPRRPLPRKRARAVAALPRRCMRMGHSDLHAGILVQRLEGDDSRPCAPGSCEPPCASVTLPLC